MIVIWEIINFFFLCIYDEGKAGYQSEPERFDYDSDAAHSGRYATLDRRRQRDDDSDFNGFDHSFIFLANSFIFYQIFSDFFQILYNSI